MLLEVGDVEHLGVLIVGLFEEASRCNVFLLELFAEVLKNCPEFGSLALITLRLIHALHCRLRDSLTLAHLGALEVKHELELGLTYFRAAIHVEDCGHALTEILVQLRNDLAHSCENFSEPSLAGSTNVSHGEGAHRVKVALLEHLVHVLDGLVSLRAR